MKFTNAIGGLLAVAGTLAGALTEDQRVQDFQALSAIYAKSYAPANWKIQALGVNIFDTADWLKRVRAAKSDLEHTKILMEYAGSFQDTHTQVLMQSNFYADLGFYCDLYDGKAIIDLIDRALLPARSYPFVTGDEFVSIDGRPALEVARELMKEQGWGNPRAALRMALDRVTFRQQAEHPLAVDLPEESTVVIRRQNGELATYKIKWDRLGFPIRDLGAAASPRTLSKGLRMSEVDATGVDAILDLGSERGRRLYSAKMARLPESRLRLQKTEIVNEDGTRAPLDSVRGYGRSAPVWTPPQGFQQRLGRGGNDTFYSGTYVADGLRIGYVRMKDFLYLTNAQLSQLATEINFFNNNTDGLVVDVMRNNGGYDCAVVETAAMLIPGRFQVDGVSIRPSLSWITYFDQLLLLAEIFEDPQYVIDSYKFQRDLVVSAFGNGRGMTGSIPSCSLDFNEVSYSFAYRKPLIVLVDDFSTSAADAFPAMMQDNKRGKLVGMRTNGAGGNVFSVNAGPWSETSTSYTESLMVRSTERTYEGFPKSPFVENVGVRPDIELDYMTIDNVLNGGRSFVQAFTRIIVDEIRAAQP